VCTDEVHLPNSLAPPVPYTLELALGNLSKGEYKILSNHPGLPTEVQSFQVEAAKSMSIDDVPYAAVSSVWVPDTVRGDQRIHVDLVGVMNSTCAKISKVEVKRLNDVFVVLPILTFSENARCAIISLPFKKTIDLGPPPGDGRFLIQVRSMSGHSVDRVFTALVPDPN